MHDGTTGEKEMAGEEGNLFSQETLSGVLAVALGLVMELVTRVAGTSVAAAGRASITETKRTLEETRLL
jgi:hypothetical protein